MSTLWDIPEEETDSTGRPELYFTKMAVVTESCKSDCFSFLLFLLYPRKSGGGEQSESFSNTWSASLGLMYAFTYCCPNSFWMSYPRSSLWLTTQSLKKRERERFIIALKHHNSSVKKWQWLQQVRINSSFSWQQFRNNLRLSSSMYA